MRKYKKYVKNISVIFYFASLNEGFRRFESLRVYSQDSVLTCCMLIHVLNDDLVAKTEIIRVLGHCHGLENLLNYNKFIKFELCEYYSHIRKNALNFKHF